MNPIDINRVIPPELIRLDDPAKSADASGSFAGMLDDAFAQMREIQGEADDQVRRLLAGEPVDLHRVILAGEKAGLATNLMMSIRNKVVDAYQEVMRMQV